MRNLITLLAILLTGVVMAQRPDLSTTISGTTFHVSTVGTDNVLTITGSSLDGSYTVVDGAFLDELYTTAPDIPVPSSINIPISSIVNSSNYHSDYTGPVSNIRFSRFSWIDSERTDMINVLGSNIPDHTNEDLMILDSERGILDTEFILTLDKPGYVDLKFTIMLDDQGGYSIFEHAPVSDGGARSVYFSEPNGVCTVVPLVSSEYNLLKAGIYTVIYDHGFRLYPLIHADGQFDFAPDTYSNTCGL